MKELDDAIINGNISDVINLMDEYAVTTNDITKKTSLAASYGHINIIKYFISKYANIKNINYDKVVQFAADSGHVEIVKYLVELGANISVNKNYAFNISSENGHLDVVKYLVSVGASVTDDYYYAIIGASRNGHLDVVKYLISAGVNVKLIPDNLIRWATVYGNLDVVKYLVSVGCDIHNYGGRAPVITAIIYNQTEIVKYLVSIGANVSSDIGDVIEVDLINDLFNDGCFELLYKILKNCNRYLEIKKLISKINDNLLINNIHKINNFTDVLLECTHK